MKTYIKTLVSLFALVLGAGTLLSIDTMPSPEFPDHVKAQIDLPANQHIMNVGSEIDGYGLCVYSSITVSARWHNLTDMLGFRKFAEGRPGGASPDKIEVDLPAYAKRSGVTIPHYLQHTGGDETFLRLVMETRRMPGITYAGVDGFYSGVIAHMVNCAHLDGLKGAIIDNNRPGSWICMSNPQLVNRWKGLGDDGKPLLIPVRQGARIIHTPVGGGWCFVWLGPPPPPKAQVIAEQWIPIPTPMPAGPRYVWEREVLDDDLPYWFLYSDGTLIFVVTPDGKWHLATGPNTWSIEPLEETPTKYPPPEVQELTKDQNNGVEFWKISAQHRFFYDGIEITRGKAVAAVLDPGADGIVDDSDKYHLSIIGADKKTVDSWFEGVGSCAKYTKRVHIQVYKPTDWPATDRLTTNLTVQEPAKVGGKIVATNTAVTEAAVKKALSDVFDPPATPVKPAPSPNVPNNPPAPNTPVDTPVNGLKVLLVLLCVLGAVYVVVQESKPSEETE